MSEKIQGYMHNSSEVNQGIQGDDNSLESYQGDAPNENERATVESNPRGIGDLMHSNTDFFIGSNSGEANLGREAYHNDSDSVLWKFAKEHNLLGQSKEQIAEAYGSEVRKFAEVVKNPGGDIGSHEIVTRGTARQLADLVDTMMEASPVLDLSSETDFQADNGEVGDNSAERRESRKGVTILEIPEFRVKRKEAMRLPIRYSEHLDNSGKSVLTFCLPPEYDELILNPKHNPDLIKDDFTRQIFVRLRNASYDRDIRAESNDIEAKLKKEEKKSGGNNSVEGSNKSLNENPEPGGKKIEKNKLPSELKKLALLGVSVICAFTFASCSRENNKDAKDNDVNLVQEEKDEEDESIDEEVDASKKLVTELARELLAQNREPGGWFGRIDDVADQVDEHFYNAALLAGLQSEKQGQPFNMSMPVDEWMKVCRSVGGEDTPERNCVLELLYRYCDIPSYLATLVDVLPRAKEIIKDSAGDGREPLIPENVNSVQEMTDFFAQNPNKMIMVKAVIYNSFQKNGVYSKGKMGDLDDSVINYGLHIGETTLADGSKVQIPVPTPYEYKYDDNEAYYKLCIPMKDGDDIAIIFACQCGNFLVLAKDAKITQELTTLSDLIEEHGGKVHFDDGEKVTIPHESTTEGSTEKTEETTRPSTTESTTRPRPTKPSTTEPSEKRKDFKESPLYESGKEHFNNDEAPGAVTKEKSKKSFSEFFSKIKESVRHSSTEKIETPKITAPNGHTIEISKVDTEHAVELTESEVGTIKEVVQKISEESESVQIQVSSKESFDSGESNW